jgi:group I intron endonuclease
MSMEKKAYIYTITNPEGKIYVGQTNNPTIRLSGHKYHGDVKGAPEMLRRSIVCFGFDAHKFEVIEECSLSKRSEREVYWIEKLDTLNNGLNMSYKKNGVWVRSAEYDLTIKLGRSKAEKEVMGRLYKKMLPEYMNGGSLTELCKKYAMSADSFLRRLKKSKITYRRKSNFEDVMKSKNVVALYGSGMSLLEISKIVGFSDRAVYNFIKKYSKARRRSAWRKRIVLDTYSGVYYESMKDLCTYLGKSPTTVSESMKNTNSKYRRYIYA